ncbi:MAG: hypothetical protein U1A78_18505 [Polyangia bacterium]
MPAAPAFRPPWSCPMSSPRPRRGALLALGALLAAAGPGCREASHPPPAAAPAPVAARPADAARTEPPAPAPAVTPTPPGDVDRLLAELDAPCADAAACAEPRSGTLFELASLLTTRDHELATPARLDRLAAALVAALPADAPLLRDTALAGTGVLAAVSEPGRRALVRAHATEALLALLADPPTPRARGRGLLALGALVPELGGSAHEEPARRLLRGGLRAKERFVMRQAVLGATLSRDEALDGPLLGALRRSLGLAAGEGAIADEHAPAAVPPLPAVPQALPAELATDLMPLLSSYVDLLQSLQQPAARKTAEELLAAALRHDPRSGTAHFLLAQLHLARPAERAAGLESLRTALALHNLPETFAASLPEELRELQPPIDLAAARAEVRRLLAQRPADLYADHAPRLTAARLAGAGGDQGPAQPDVARASVRTVSPRELERRAEEVLRRDGPGSPAALRLGEELFTLYPFGSEEYYDSCLRSFLLPAGNNHDLLDRLGLSYESTADEARRVVGVVAAEDGVAPEGGKRAWRYGVTCALCHSQVDAAGHRWDGLPARMYDQGLLLAACVDQPIHHKAQNRNLAELMEYLPGRNDSASDAVHDPTDIPALYGVRAGGAVRWNGDTPTLKVQIDRNLSQRSAPQAVLQLVAGYLRGLALPPPPLAAGRVWARGKALFAMRCASCHAGPAYTSGQIVAVEELGTDRTRVSAVLPNSSEGYKVPSLLRIGRSAPYLHDGSVPTLSAMLDPARPGGHRFGHTLPAADRTALVEFLRSL